jgi:hypothetical protein
MTPEQYMLLGDLQTCIDGHAMVNRLFWTKVAIYISQGMKVKTVAETLGVTREAIRINLKKWAEVRRVEHENEDNRASGDPSIAERTTDVRE